MSANLLELYQLSFCHTHTGRLVFRFCPWDLIGKILVKNRIPVTRILERSPTIMHNDSEFRKSVTFCRQLGIHEVNSPPPPPVRTHVQTLLYLYKKILFS